MPRAFVVFALVCALVGFTLSVTTAAVEDATVTLQVTAVTYVSPQQVVFQGTLTCDQPLSGDLSIVLTGRVHPGTVVPQPSVDLYPFNCAGETELAIAVPSVRGLAFHVGQDLAVYAEFTYCSDTACFSAISNTKVTVQR
jgi:hypothetical protein